MESITHCKFGEIRGIIAITQALFNFHLKGPFKMETPRCFISYSWDSEQHQEWVRKLATRLRECGVDAILDQFHCAPGTDLTKFMEKSVRESSFVLLVCTPNFARKADAGVGGVGYEKAIVTGEIFGGEARETKFVPLLLEGDAKESLPCYLKSRFFIDFREDGLFEAKLEELLRHFHGEPLYPLPPIGSKPDWNKEEEAKRKAEEERKRKEAEEGRKRSEAEAKRKAEEERKLKEARAKRRPEEERKRDKEKAQIKPEEQYARKETETTQEKESKLKRLWKWVNQHAAAIMVVFAVIGGGGVLYETFIVKPQEKKEKRVRTYLNDFKSGEYRKAYIELENFWNSRSELNTVPSECYPKLAVEMLKLFDHTKQITILQGLYDTISRCVIENRCDKELACKEFSQIIYDFSYFYSEVLYNLGTQTQPLNRNMVKFAKEVCGERAADLARGPCKREIKIQKKS